MRRARGFTLVELMTVVTIMAVIAAVAIISVRKNKSEFNSDAWANAFRNSAIQARRRAVATGQPFMIELKQTQLQWCQVDLAACRSASTMSCTPPLAAGFEGGQVVFAGNDAMTDSWAAAADVLSYNNAYAGPAKTTIGASTKQIFFGPRGTVDVVCNNLYANPTGSGFTAYMRASNATTNATFQQKRRRVVILGATGRPRIIDNW